MIEEYTQADVERFAEHLRFPIYEASYRFYMAVRDPGRREGWLYQPLDSTHEIYMQPCLHIQQRQQWQQRQHVKERRTQKREAQKWQQGVAKILAECRRREALRVPHEKPRIRVPAEYQHVA